MTYKLMIADDDEQSRITLANCFPWSQVGFEIVFQASDGLSAWEYLQSHPPVDAILCDINMPVMDGLELATRLRELPYAPALILFSGYREFSYAYRALQLGIRFFLLKPIKYEDIIETFSAIRQQLDEKNGISDKIMEESSSQDFISKAQNYIRENYKTVTLTGLSKEFFMNSSYVSQIFKQRTGQNFSEYLTQVRMQKAVQLLATTDEKIYVISAEVGYANTKYFIRAFRRYYRMSPSEYREQNQNT